MTACIPLRPLHPDRKKRTKWPPPWRKPEDVELAEEIRDLERDNVLHSDAPSGTMDGKIQAHGQQPETKECDEAETGGPMMSRFRRRRSTGFQRNGQVIDLSHEIRDLECDIALRPEALVDMSVDSSARSARTLKRAVDRIARVDAAHARLTPKDKRRHKRSKGLRTIKADR